MILAVHIDGDGVPGNVAGLHSGGDNADPSDRPAVLAALQQNCIGGPE